MDRFPEIFVDFTTQKVQHMGDLLNILLKAWLNLYVILVVSS